MPRSCAGMFASPQNPYVEGSDGEESEDECHSWVKNHCSHRGNEYFCEVDNEFILDRFNLTGLGHDVMGAQQGYDLIIDEYESKVGDHPPPHVQAAARILYGLIHARFIITPAGLSRMKKKYLREDFGTCPRVLCRGQSLIPVGMSDCLRSQSVKLFCCHCEDVYNPKSSAHNAIDGAYFGTTFPHLFFQTYPNLIPARNSERYVPKIFGFGLAGTPSNKPDC